MPYRQWRTKQLLYTQCYISGGGTLQCLSRRENSRINSEVGNELTNEPPHLLYLLLEDSKSALREGNYVM